VPVFAFQALAMDIQKLLEILPHRYPMLLVDRIIWVADDGRACKGLKNVTMNEPFFQGHYPGRPIMPGVLIIETMAQVGAAILLSLPEFSDSVPLIGAIDEVRFKRLVTPGDQLISECTIMWVRGRIGKMKGVATVDGEVAASMEMTFKLGKKDT
jgi:beta-hydroxyacyl-ACP dehydratase FabZ